MTAPPKRRWFSFSLRTMFVVVTLAACSLGWLFWQLQIVRERKAVLAEISRLAKLDGREFEHIALESFQAQRKAGFDWSGFPEARVSRIRLLLGDESYPLICISSNLDPAWIRRAEYAFPEAQLHVKDYEAEKLPFDPNNPSSGVVAFRDSLYQVPEERQPNFGTIFETGLIEN